MSTVYAEQPGAVVRHLALPGAGVSLGTQVLVVETMKFETTICSPAAGVLEGVPRQFRDDGGNACLVRRVEAEQTGNLPGPLPREHNVVLLCDADRQQPPVHRLSRATTTVTSSRCRLHWRYSTAAMTDGWRDTSPGRPSNDQWADSPSECITSSASVSHG